MFILYLLILDHLNVSALLSNPITLQRVMIGFENSLVQSRHTDIFTTPALKRRPGQENQ